MRSRSFIAAAAVVAAPALAVPTHTGEGTYALPGTTAAAEPTLAGMVLKDELVPFKVYATKDVKPMTAIVGTGTIQVRVVKAQDGTLTFYWKVNYDAGSQPVLRTVLVDKVPDRAYDVNWRKDGLGSAAPSQVKVVKYPDGHIQYRFLFDNQPIAPGQSSRFFYLKTGATAYVPANNLLTPLGPDNTTSTVAVAGVLPTF